MDPQSPLRCPWARHPLEIEYHDREWGVPVHDDRRHFEFLVLDGAQAGLSWLAILKRREASRRAFAGFDPEAVARFGETEVLALLRDEGIVRNRRKIEGAIRNARAFLRAQEAYGSFDAFVWRFTQGRTLRNAWREPAEVPATSPESEAMSRELRRLGFCFVGPTICYAYMQAAGMVDDHLVGCFRHGRCG
ncbi:MAG: DNA-3-methyladenine glycosylase I [Fimbriimonadales bacterium]|nr:DNA-3-methyladenine glycosylase I [Fimbriimonadales bacterium]